MKIGIDIETTALEPEDGRISLIQVADPEGGIKIYDTLTGTARGCPTTR
jgi:ribonuclease D